MAVAAHPGDALFSMGAPVALHIQRGGTGVFVNLSLGEKGHRTIPPARYGEMQREAMLKAAAIVGAQTEFLPYPDAAIPSGDRIAFEVCDLIRKYKPAIVLTHWQGSWHKDHQNTFLVVRDAAFYAGLAAFERSLPAHDPRRILYPENWEDAANYRPDIYLDISPVFDKWVKACAVFPMWRGETGLIRYDDHYKSLAVMRGSLAGCAHAVTLMRNPEDRPPAVDRLDF
jgi:LmbE family N-acetylglucosaminyl deacetylase